MLGGPLERSGFPPPAGGFIPPILWSIFAPPFSVVTLSVEGVSRSAIARIERLAWNTVARWLERATVCRRFSDGRTTGFVATELQADEIRSFTGGKTPADVGVRGD